MPRSRCKCSVYPLVIAIMLFAAAGSLRADAEKLYFEIEEGEFVANLKAAAYQADVELLFALGVPQGWKTHEVKGHFTISEAFDLMLEGTPCKAVPVSGGKAFAIMARVKKRDSGEARLGEELQKHIKSEIRSSMNSENNNKKRTLQDLLKALVSVAVATSPALYAQEGEAGDDVYELSPFTVSSKDDSGYRATTTLAGTRLKTQIKDVGSAISVLTEELFEDTGATDAATVLSYALNTEVAGPQGNFSGNTAAAGLPNLSPTRVNPQANGQRVRGLGRATLTRNYFLTDIPFDSYNTDRVTINRGPNSLLFGIGEPGGIINNSAKPASVAEDFGEISARIGERGSTRFSFDVNRTIVEERLAIRVSALREEQKFQQKPAFEEDERFYVALNSVLSKNENSELLGPTILRASYENGEISSTPPNVIAPLNSFEEWFSNPNRSIEALTGVPLPAYVDDGTFQPKFTIDGRPGLTPGNVNGSSLQGPFFIQFAQVFEDPNSPEPGLSGTGFTGYEGRILFNGVSRGRFDLISPVSLIGTLPGFVTPSLSSSMFDNEKLLLTGSLDSVVQDFDAFNVVLEQSFLDNKAGIELVFDRQTYRNQNRLPLGSRPEVRVDANEYIQVGPEGSNGVNGESDFPNPNLGRAFVAAGNLGGFNDNETEREAFRATAFYTLDFRDNDSLSWLGSHTFTGLYTEQTIDRLNRSFEDRWFDDGTFDIQDPLFAPLNGFRRQDPGIFYLTDSLLGANIQSPSDIRIENGLSAQLLQDGDSGFFSAWNRTDSIFENVTPVIGRTLSGGNRDQLFIDSTVASWQGRFFDGAIVGLLGYRTDNTEGLEDSGNALLGSSAGVFQGAFDPANLVLDPTSLATDGGNTVTKSLVVHLPWQLPKETEVSFHYNESENFSPAGPRRTILNNPIGAPFGETKDYGVRFGLFSGKVVASVNWFETTRNLAAVQTGSLGSSISWINQWLTRWQEGIDTDLPFQEALESVTQNGALGPIPTQFQSYQDVFDHIIGFVPAEVQSNLNFRIENGVARFDPINNLAATNSFVTEGFEIDVVGNITPNWRVAFNLGQQETIQSNTAPDLSAFVLGPGGVFENVQASPLANFSDSPVRGFENTFIGRYTNAVVNPLAAARARDGTLSQEQREWRANLTTNYFFAEDSALSGFGVGGAVRWQDSIATGYPQIPLGGGVVTPDLARPFFGPDETNVDLWLSYKRKLSDGKFTWKSQLNIRNAFGSDDLIPVITNPDGRVAIFRNSNPTDIFWTNTLEF